MKITIITVTLNSEATIRDTLNSVLSQTYKNIEHIIIDGGSKDKTLDIIKAYPNQNKKLYKLPKSGIYKAINFGIKKSGMSYITILNSDDFFQSNDSVLKMVKKIKKHKKISVFFSNVVYFKDNNFINIKRLFSSIKFKRWHLSLGLMPAHPGSYIKKSIYMKYGMYEESFKIASDFDFFLRILYINRVNFKNIDMTSIRMRLGGISGKNIWSYVISTKEILESFKINKIKKLKLIIFLRFVFKVEQLFFYNKDKINKSFKNYKIHFDVNEMKKKSFVLIDKLNKIPFKNNFILSAMNLAFLGYLIKNKVNFHKNQYHWLDGVWAKRYIGIKKKPGRELVDKLKIPSTIKTIYVVGNITKKTTIYLKKKFKKKIINIKLPYAPISVLKKQKIILPKNSLTFVTLPTPKQEQLAYSLAKNNKNYKVICIGASLAIASGEERKVPNFLSNYEFIWRLRTDTWRRIKRLLESLYFYTKGSIIQKKYDKIYFREIE